MKLRTIGALLLVGMLVHPGKVWGLSFAEQNDSTPHDGKTANLIVASTHNGRTDESLAGQALAQQSPAEKNKPQNISPNEAQTTHTKGLNAGKTAQNTTDTPAPQATPDFQATRTAQNTQDTQKTRDNPAPFKQDDLLWQNIFIDKQDGVTGSLCFSGELGFMLDVPEGWKQVPEYAQHYGLCAFWVPETSTPSTSSVALYTRIVPLPDTNDPVQAFVDMYVVNISKKYKDLSIEVRQEENSISQGDVTFHVRFFDNGPHPNCSEVVAYHLEDTFAFLVVLSAVDERVRTLYLPSFKQALDSTVPVKIDN